MALAAPAQRLRFEKRVMILALVLGLLPFVRNELALILADADDRLHYASTTRSAMLPLADVVGREIIAADQPGLLASSRSAIRDWVHLAYLDRNRDMIAYARLEPQDETDPVERAGAAGGSGDAAR